ncbi:SDR family oxidoreductase [Myxococcota bacterium]|nr:SDR family oxidoreductase [Myxococcota bacterium]
MGARGMLEGRVALISGVGPGLGTELARLFAREGADISMGARSEDTLREVGEEIVELGRRCIWQPTDVTDTDACASLADETRAQLGGIDILVNNAFWEGGEGLLEDGNIENWRTAMEVNFLGALTMTHAAIPGLKASSNGRVIMVSSIGARNIQPAAGAYASSKAALNSVTKTLARELGPHGIRVNALVPGWIWGRTTETALRSFAEEQGVPFEQLLEQNVAMTALGYLPEAPEIAKVGLFLASDLSASVTGHMLDANAGQWM